MTAKKENEERNTGLSVGRLMLKRLWRKGSARIGGGIIILLILMAIGAPFIATHDPFEMNIIGRLEAPGGEHLLGTDEMGRDLFSRIIYGSRITLQIGIISVGISLVAGTLLGLLSGYLGGTFDLLFMRLVDILMAFPGFILALGIVAVLGPSLQNAMIAVGISGIAGYIRTVRGSTLEIKQEVYIEAIKAQGAKNRRILFRHVLPNIISPVLVMATLQFPAAILSAAGLSFIGLGAQPPTPEWGALLVRSRVYMELAPWLVNFPGVAILFSVLGFNLLGNAVRDVFDPKLKH